MIQAILNGKDAFHCVTASLMFGISYEDVHIAKLVMNKVGQASKYIRSRKRGSLPDNDKLCAYYRGRRKDDGFALLYGAVPKKIRNAD